MTEAPPPFASIAQVEAVVVGCRRCPRLVAWREEVARTRRAAFADQEYWGRPVPAFGDPDARLLVVGLAPAAHGGNRTGRSRHGLRLATLDDRHSDEPREQGDRREREEALDDARAQL